MDAPAETQPQVKRRPRRSNVSRVFRADLSEIDNSIAEELLREFASFVHHVATTWERQFARSPAFFLIEVEDLIATGNAAVLEAWTSYRDGDVTRDTNTGPFGGGFAAHVRRIIVQRVSDYVEGLRHNSPLATSRYLPQGDMLTAQADAESRFYDAELRIWLRTALARLSLRERAVVAGVIRGDSQAQLGRELGLDRRAVHRVYHQALTKLRAHAAQYGLEIEIAALREGESEGEE